MRYVTYQLDWTTTPGSGIQPYVLWDASQGANFQGGAAVQENVYFGYCTGTDASITANIAACAARFIMTELTLADAQAWFAQAWAGSTSIDANRNTNYFNGTSVDANGFIVPVYTAWGTQTVAQLQTQQATQLKLDCDALVLAHYPVTNMLSLSNMLTVALAGLPAMGGNAAIPPMPNRAAYLSQVLGWAQAVTTMFYTVEASIIACTTQAQVLAITWNTQLTALGSLDPLVTIAGAQAITS